MINFKKKLNAGFTVVEVLVAMAIITIVITATIMTTRSAIRATQDAIDYGLATTLAEEGIEMVKNVRDTNFLKYSAYKDDCWNYWKQADVVPATLNPPTLTDNSKQCDEKEDGGSKIVNGVYTVYIDPNDKSIILKGSGSAENANDTANVEGEYSPAVVSAYPLYLLAKVCFRTDVVSGSCTNKFYANYAKMFSVDTSPPESAPYAKDSDTKFYRQIKIDGVTADEQMNVTSLVYWQGSGEKKQVELKTILTNYVE